MSTIRNGLLRLTTVWMSITIAAQPILAQSITTTPISGDLNIYDGANGVPIVDIVAPSAQGVSHNIFGELNVGEAGLIFNNADQNFVNTQLAGQIYGNTNLQSGPAKIILNEVIYNNPSELLGFMEVAGANADLIIANPYGVTCNGCGFINTDHATLTTGTPFYEGGAFQGFNVARGSVAIGALGADARGVSRFDILARKIDFAGAVHGQEVTIVAGKNDIIYATGAISERDANGEATTDMAIDSTVLGGMYASSIKIISNENGAGVRAPATMAANAGEMTITADGRLVLGRAQASGNVKVKAEEVVVEKLVRSEESIRIEAARNAIAEENAQIVANSAVAIQASNSVRLDTSSFVIARDGTVNVDAGGMLELGNDASIQATGSVDVSAGELSASNGSVMAAGIENEAGEQSAADATINVDGAATLSGSQVYASNNLQFDAATIDIGSDAIDPSQFVAAGDIDLNAQRIEAQGAVIASGNTLSIYANEVRADDAQIQAANDIAVSGLNNGALSIEGGQLTANNALTLSGAGVTNSAALVAINGDLAITSTRGLSNTGALYAGDHLVLTSDGALSNTGALTGVTSVALNAGSSLGNDGNFVSGGAVTILAHAALVNSGSGANTANGIVDANGNPIADAANLTLQGAVVHNSGSALIIGDILFDADAGDLTNAGNLTAGQIIDLAARDSLANSGVLFGHAGLSLAGGQLENTEELATSGDLILSSTAGNFSNAADLFAGGALSLAALGAIDNAGQLVGVTSVILDAGRALTNAGDFLSSGAVAMNAGGALINAGSGANTAQANGGADATAFTLAGASVENSGDALVTTTVNLSSNAGRLINSGDLAALGALTMASADALESFGALYANTDLSLRADGTLSNDGSLTGVTSVSLLAGADLSNSGDFLSTGIVSMSAGATLVNSGSGANTAQGIVDSAGNALADASTLSFMGASIENNGSALIVDNIRFDASNGDIESAGDLTTFGALTFGAEGDIANYGNLNAGADLFLIAGGHLANDGALFAGQNATLAAGDFDIGASIEALGSVDIDGLVGASAITGSVAANGDITVTGANDLTIGGGATLQSYGTLLAIESEGVLTSDGTLGAAQDITLGGQSVNVAGTLTAQNNLSVASNTGAVTNDAIIGAYALDVVSAGEFENTGEITATIASFDIGQDFTNAGGINTSVFKLTSGGFVNNTTINANHQAFMTTSGNFENAGIIASAGIEGLDITGNILIDAGGAVDNFGTIDAAQLLSIEGASLANNGGTLEGGAVAITLDGTLDNSANIIATLGGVDIVTGMAVENTGVIQSNGLLTIETIDFANLGEINAYNGVASIEASGTFDITNGTIFSDTGIRLRFDGGVDAHLFGGLNTIGFIDLAGVDDGYLDYFTVLAGEELGAIGNLSVKAKSVNNEGAVYSATGDLNLSVEGDIYNGGVIYAGGDWMQLLLGGTLDNNGSAILANNNMVIAGADYGAYVGAGPDGIAGTADDVYNTDVRANAIINQHEGRIETIQGDMRLLADGIENRREHSTVENTVFEDYSQPGKVTTYSGCFVDGTCRSGTSSSDFNDSGTITSGNPDNYQFRHRIVSTTFETNENASQIRSGRDLLVDGDTVTNEYSLISAAGDIVLEVGLLKNLGVRSGDGVAFGWSFSQSGIASVNAAFQPGTGSLGVFVNESDYFTDLGQSFEVRIRLDTETGIITKNGFLIEYAKLDNFEFDPDPNIYGWLTGRYLIHSTVVEWGDFNSPMSLIAGSGEYHYGTIEAGGSITGYVGEFTSGVEAYVTSFGPRPTSPTFGRRDDSPTELAANTPTQADLDVGVIDGVADGALGDSVRTGVDARDATITLDGQNVGRFDGVAGEFTRAALTDSTLNLASFDDSVSAPTFDPDDLTNDLLFVIAPNPASGYLIETRYEFIDQSAFASSDYFLSAIGVAPVTDAPIRLGDAFVETSLIRDQIFAQTGRTILEPGLSEAEQIRLMYDNAVNAALDLRLRPGVALSPAQQAALTEDIIWLETQNVNGVDVLVPVVYFANGGAQYASLGGAQVVAGSGINLQVDNLTNNGGSLISNKQVIISATNDIINNGGLIQGGANGIGFDANGNQLSIPSVLLSAGGDVANYSGTITGVDVDISATNIINETRSVRFGDDTNYYDLALATASIGGTGDATLIAISDITFVGADLAAGGDAFIQAGGDINFAALELESATSWRSSSGGGGLFGGRSKTSVESYNLTNDVSSLSAGGNLTIISTGASPNGEGEAPASIIFEGTDIAAGGRVGVAALGGNVVFDAPQDISSFAYSSSSRGFLSRSSSQTQSYELTHQTASITGSSIDVYAAGSVQAYGSDFTTVASDGTVLHGEDAVAAGTLNIQAGSGDIEFYSVQNIDAYSRKSSRSFLAGLISRDSESQSLVTTHDGVELASVRDINLTANRDIVIQGGSIEALGDINPVAGGKVYLQGTVDTSYSFSHSNDNNGWIITDTTEVKQTQTASMPSIVAGGANGFATLDNAVIGGREFTGELDENGNPIFAVSSTHAMGVTSIGQVGTFDEAGAFVPFFGGDEGGSGGGGGNPYADGTRVEIAAITPGGVGYEYLDALVANDASLVENAVRTELTQIDYYEQTVAPGVLTQAAIIIATQGMGTWQAFALNQLVTAGITGELDLEAVVRDAAFTFVTAGVGVNGSGEALDGWQGINGEISRFFGEIGLNLSTTSPLGAANGLLSDYDIVTGLVTTVTDAGINSLVYGSDLGDNLGSGFQNFAINQAMAVTQFGIGEIRGGEGSLIGTVLHAGAGCAFSEIQGGECANGAAAAGLADVTTGILVAGTASRDAVLAASKVYNPVYAALASGGDNAQFAMNIGINASAANNNYLNHDDVANLKSDIANCGADKGCIDDVLIEYNKLSEAKNLLLEQCEDWDCIQNALGEMHSLTSEDLTFMRSLVGAGTSSHGEYLDMQQIEANLISNDAAQRVAVGEKFNLSPQQTELLVAIGGAFLAGKDRIATKGGVPCCFVAGTPVKTVGGYKNIEELKVGDEVLSQNVETGSIETNVVTDTFIRPISEIKTFYKLTIGSDDQSEDLFVTGEHPFWVTDLEEWITVDDLQVGAELTNHRGENLTVHAKALETKLQQTYNITVAGNNNYFAGELETLVHNCSPNQIKQQIAKGQAPNSVKRIDTAEASVPGSQDHIEFSDGRALNRDGTWRHGTGGGSGTGTLTNKEKKWLESIGWTIPD